MVFGINITIIIYLLHALFLNLAYIFLDYPNIAIQLIDLFNVTLRCRITKVN